MKRERERDKNTTEKDYARTRKFDKTNSTFEYEYALNSLKTNIDLGGEEEKKTFHHVLLMSDTFGKKLIPTFLRRCARVLLIFFKR